MPSNMLTVLSCEDLEVFLGLRVTHATSTEGFPISLS